jgi:hypothetical protein
MASKPISFSCMHARVFLLGPEARASNRLTAQFRCHLCSFFWKHYPRRSVGTGRLMCFAEIPFASKTIATIAIVCVMRHTWALKTLSSHDGGLQCPQPEMPVRRGREAHLTTTVQMRMTCKHVSFLAEGEIRRTMAQRLTYRRRHCYATRSNKTRVVKTPGAHTVICSN